MCVCVFYRSKCWLTLTWKITEIKWMNITYTPTQQYRYRIFNAIVYWNFINTIHIQTICFTNCWVLCSFLFFLKIYFNVGYTNTVHSTSWNNCVFVLLLFCFMFYSCLPLNKEKTNFSSNNAQLNVQLKYVGNAIQYYLDLFVG